MATFTVTTASDVVDDTDDVLSLREAIAMANATPEADEIVFDIGTATINIEGDLQFMITAPLAIDGGGTVTVDADDDSRIFMIGEDAATTLRNITLTDGVASEAGEGGGGAIRSLSDLVLEMVTIRGSAATVTDGTGGAVSVEGTLSVTGGLFEDNATSGIDGLGGALFASGDVTISDATFDENLTEGAEASGGAVYAGGTLTISGATFTANETRGDDAPGGAVFANGAVTVATTDFAQNRTTGADATGGAIHAGGALSITGGSLTDNLTEGTGSAGGAAWTGGALTLAPDGDTRVTVSDNATGAGTGPGSMAPGGAFFVTDSATITDADLAGNATGGAMSPGGAISAGEDVTLTDVGLTDNETEGDDSGGGAVAAGGAVTVAGSAIAGNATAGARSPGGAVFTDDAVSISTSVIEGNTTSGAESPGGAVRGADVTLANTMARFDAAGASGGTSGASAPGGLVAAFGALSVSNGDFSDHRTTGADSPGGTFYATGATTISAVTVADSSTGGANSSGGAVASGGALTVTASTLSESATAGNDAKGGAVFGSATVRIEGSTIENNATAGINAFGGGVAAIGDLAVVDTTVSGNQTSGSNARGGGVSTEGDLTLFAVTVSGNATTGDTGFGGGAYAEDGALVSNATIAANSTAGTGAPGGGIFVSGAVTLLKTTISGNQTTGGNSAGGGIFHTTDRLFGDTVVLGNAAVAGAAEENDEAGGSEAGRTDLGSVIVGPGDALPEAVFADTFALTGDVLAGTLADNGGQVATIALNPQAQNPAIDRGLVRLLDETARQLDLNADGDLTDVFITDARGAGFERDRDIFMVGFDGAGTNFGDIGAFEAPGANRPPMAVLDERVITETTGAVTIDVLLNDTDPDPNTVLVVTDVDFTGIVGTATLEADGRTIRYDSVGAFNELSAGEEVAEVIPYTISDQQGGTASSVARFVIEGQNDRPVAQDDTGQVAARAAMPISVDVVANDTDVDANDTLRIAELDTDATLGQATISEDGRSILYDPAGAFDDLAGGSTASDTIGYTVSDGNGGTDEAQLVITVTGEDFVNMPPVAIGDFAEVFSGATIRIDPLIDNGSGSDSDPEDGPLTVTEVTVPENGRALLLEDGTVLYRSRDGFTGADSFEYTVADEFGATASATVALSVSEDMRETSLPLDEAQEVAYAYEAALDRDGEIDLEGLNFWIRARFNGLSEEDLALAFLSNPEFLESFGDPNDFTDRELVELFYRNVLDRDGEEAGIQFWTNALADPFFERTDLLLSFAGSPENAIGSPQIASLTEIEEGNWGFA